MSKRESIEEYARKGQKIMAIKIYREACSVSLKEAKDAVESYMSSSSWSPAQLGALGETSGASAATPSMPELSGLAAIEALVQQDKKIHAIKELRTLTNTGLREAKNAVDLFMSTGAWPGAMSSLDGKLEGPPKKTGSLDLDAVEEQARSGKKIPAIKELRRVTQMSLAEAKRTVEHFMAHAAWPTTLIGAPKPSAKAQAVPKPPPATPERARPTISTSSTSVAQATTTTTTTATAAPEPVKAAQGDPEAEEAARALMSHVGSGEIDLILPTKKNLFAGYLAMIGERAFFMVQRFGSWEVDGEYARSERLGVEVRASFSRVELRLRAGYLQDNFTGLDEEQARTIAARLGG